LPFPRFTILSKEPPWKKNLTSCWLIGGAAGMRAVVALFISHGKGKQGLNVTGKDHRSPGIWTVTHSFLYLVKNV
jgi:hypothetical protein